MNTFKTLERIHVLLRQNDLKSAEKNLRSLERALGNVDPNSSSGEEALCYFWYYAILKRKSNQLSKAEQFFTGLSPKQRRALDFW